MAGINAIAARIALIAAINNLLPDVEVSYSFVGKLQDGAREYVFGGDRDDGSLTLSAMANRTRVKREEAADFTLHIVVTEPGEETHQATSVRACELGGQIENYIAMTWLLGGVPNLSAAHVTGWSLVGSNNDDGARSTLTYSITFDSYLE